MSVYLFATSGAPAPADHDSVRRLLASDELLWLDLCQPTGDELALLRDVFGIHPLAAEDADHFGQRPKLEEYDDFSHLVFYGAASMDAPLVEVHCFYSRHYLVTVRRDDCPAFADIRDWLQRRVKASGRLLLLHRVLDGLADSFFPVLSGFDDRIDELQDAILVKPTDQQLSDLFALKRWLIGVRKVVTPQRDLAAAVVSGVLELPGMTREIERYFRDLYDHLIRISDLVDSYRDLLSGSMDSYLSTVSNRLNVVMKQLAVIATIFLPLTFLTGFFGQNFAWMVRRLTGFDTFLVAGLGTEAVAVVGMIYLFHRRGWL